jgi:protein-disulfide isomerase
MKRVRQRFRWASLLLCGPFLAAGLAPAKAKPKPTSAPAPAAAPVAGGVEKRLAEFVNDYLPWEPDSKVAIQKGDVKMPGFTSWKVTRTGRFETLNAEATVFVSSDGKWFYEGDSFANRAPRPVRSAADLDWIASRYANLLHAKVRPELVPERDAAGLKGLVVLIETGYGPVRVPGLVTTDGSAFLGGTLYDFQSDPRAERRRRIDLTAQRASGPADAAVTIVEYADMECGYCKMRGRQLDKLLAANQGIASVRRHYKFFPLWSHHPWAMKAASAGDCLSRLASPAALFRFKELAYGRQDSLSVSTIDELAITSAEGEGVPNADFLGCYLRDDSFDRIRKDLDEGYRLGVNSTPTFFVDGTQVNWIEDKLMEDFLRSKFPRLKSISYQQ